MADVDPFKTLAIEETFQKLGTSPQGLDGSEVLKRQTEYGKNTLEEEIVSNWRIFFRQFNNTLIYILFAASLVSISIGELTDFLVINFIILCNGLIAFWQELKAESSISALKKLTHTRNKVMRNGKMELLSSEELVPGDFLILHEGEVVTADVRLVESSGLMVDESPITGESAPIVKDHTAILTSDAMPFELKNSLLSGTTIVRGTGRGIVVKTGNHTYLATIAEKAQEASPDTPLTRSLRFFSQRYIILLILLFSALGTIGFLQGRSFLEISYIMLASLVSAVPEGLPIVVTLVMVIGAMALSKKKTLVRYLPSVETLGSSTVIASDKTGTITEGKLIVKEVFTHDPEKLKHIAALCNDAQEGSGDPLDVALSDWIASYDEIRTKYPRKWGYSFDSKLMLMATVNALDHKEELLIKGAFEALKEKVENKETLAEIEPIFNQFLSQGLRVLAFGAGNWNGEDPSKWKIEIIGLIGFLDPPKQEVKDAVTFAKKAGVKVIMITGDHPMTAKTVAAEVGIWEEGQKILTGKEIETMPDDHLLATLRATTVLARVLPEHKYRIVKLLQKNEEIVAVTGDGINDVPALKAANIGIAMGGGTEAAKNAAKMVITDNNLKIIVEAIKNARVIADNIRKVIYYLLSTSLQEIFLIAAAIVFSYPLPLSAIQILWINIVTDGVQDKTFPFAKAEGNVMERKPRKPEKQFFDGKQVFRILYFGAFMGVFCFFLYVYLLPIYPIKTVSTIMFTSVVVSQWANGIQAQKEEEPFFKNLRRSFTINPLIFVGCAIGILLHSLAIYAIPDVFHAIPLPLELLKYPVLTFFTAFAIVELRKWTECVIKKIKLS